MSRNRFDAIMQNLHLCDNDHLDTIDKFSEMRPLLNVMNDACLKHFLPQRTNLIPSAPLKDVKELQKEPRGSYDIAVDTNS